VGCNNSIDIKNGSLPDAYLPQTKKYEGIYRGLFESNPSQIELRIQGNIPQIIYTDNDGHEILDQSCHSKIGQLQKLILTDEKNKFLNSQAYFAFDPGNCKNIRGRELILSFISEKSFTLEILNETRQTLLCRPHGGCHSTYRNIYFYGNYSR
jgi:hypothetical protein